MKTILFLFSVTLTLAGIAQIEGGKQLVNFMKFLQNMKSKGWDKNLILANQKNFKSPISTNLEPDYYITTLESENENLILDEADYPCDNGNARFKVDCEKAAKVFRYLLDPVRL